MCFVFCGEMLTHNCYRLSENNEDVIGSYRPYSPLLYCCCEHNILFKFQDNLKREAVGIWKCKACQKTITGGAWTVR